MLGVRQCQINVIVKRKHYAIYSAKGPKVRLVENDVKIL